ncbi:MAG: TauD/TfdA family dioxygenase [Gammaproteobacteria bacterium]|nr:TauD/TfdA family dioxygenase [Gammaproteobacteria bacterium]
MNRERQIIDDYRQLGIVEWDGPLGAEVTGLDLRQALAPEVWAEIQRAWLQYGVLCFRDQQLTPAQQAEFARGFGELDVYPFMRSSDAHPHVIELVKEASSKTNFGGLWHTDTSYLPEPPKATVLYAVEVPEQGGDTLFADARAAFDDLPPSLRHRWAGARGIYTPRLVHGSTGVYGDADVQAELGARYGDEAGRAEAEVEHPLFRTHPETGRKSIYCSLVHTLRIVGMSREASLPLLTELSEHATGDRYVARLRWQPGTLAIWDNRCLFHYALNDYHGQRRHMRRVIVRGDRPR